MAGYKEAIYLAINRACPGLARRGAVARIGVIANSGGSRPRRLSMGRNGKQRQAGRLQRQS